MSQELFFRRPTEAYPIRFPVDAPRDRVIRAFTTLGFRVVREHEHIVMARQNADGSRTPLVLPAHPRIKSSTLRTACSRAGISRADFIQAYARA